MLFSDTAPGSVFQGESAARYNAVNSLLRSALFPAAETGRNPANFRLDFINASAQDISAFSPVAITGVSDDIPEYHSSGCIDGLAVVAGIPAADETLPWGIALEDVAPGQLGMLAFSGSVPAIFSGSGTFVAVSNGQLCAGNGGSARVLATCPTGPDGELHPGLLLLGGSGIAAPENEYNGIFKLQSLSGSSLKIVNGSAPDSPYCGYTDIPGCNAIPETVLTLPENKGSMIYLCFAYDSVSKSYSWSFESAVPAGVKLYRLLGRFRNGRTEQIFSDEKVTRIVFGEEWYLQ
ncbi:MAG: hypothetical protein J6S43_05635 [Lentisphaeria bacterium]|nr:hypothetical protein [Lentisphaeria bacterium]